MPNVMRVLKEEIRRLARKEAKAFFGPLRKEKIELKRRVRGVLQRCAALEREIRRLVSLAGKVQRQAPEEVKRRSWITARGVHSLRKKLGLSRSAFAKLLGVSVPSVFLWEHKKGPLKLREKTRQAIVAIRGIGVREAKRRLAELGWVDRRRLRGRKRRKR